MYEPQLLSRRAPDVLRHLSGADMTFGEWLRAARKRKKWTMEQLALRALITKSYVWELEQDHQNPSLRVLWKLADAFGVKLSTIIKALEGK